MLNWHFAIYNKLGSNKPMNTDLRNADSRALHEPFSQYLHESGPRVALAWLVSVLGSQSPALRSSNSHLVAYTGCPEAIDWLEVNVASPVTTNWGEGAALLGTPWSRIKAWLASGGPKQMMALDTLIAYRAPAPNMAPLAQIASPVLPEAPELSEYQASLRAVVAEADTPRIRKTVESALAYASEILSRKNRAVAVADLPMLFLQPEQFANASEILSQHNAVISGVRKSIQDMLAQLPSRS
ncbi:MAG TPA: hypothetical protein VFF81_09555 [Noviherbaspirillum sp.]|nr:hypothetical protein [Noviherbaspirillum sp.]